MTQATQSSDQLISAVHDFQEIAAKHLVGMDSEQTLFALDENKLSFILHILQAWRPNLSREEDIQKLWMEMIRKEAGLTDFVMALSSDLAFYNCRRMDLIEDACASYLASVYSPDAATEEFDKDLTSVLVQREHAKKLIRKYRWLMALIFLRLCDFPVLLGIAQQRSAPVSGKDK